MQIFRLKNYEEMSVRAERQLIDIINNNSKTTIGLPAGKTPTRLYELLAKDLKPEQKSRVFGLQLDEYIGYGQEDPHSFYYYLDKNFIRPCEIDPQNILAFDGRASDPTVECKRYSKGLKKFEPIDVMLLGFGWNGHIAFNEPGTAPEESVRIVTLQSNPLDIEPSNHDLMLAMTIGLKEILSAKTIILLISGRNKVQTIERFLRGEPAADLPASFLKGHEDLNVYLDETSLVNDLA